MNRNRFNFQKIKSFYKKTFKFIIFVIGFFFGKGKSSFEDHGKLNSKSLLSG